APSSDCASDKALYDTESGFLCRLVIPCELESVHRVARAVRDTLTSHRAAPEDMSACELAIVEGCNNAILYAKDLGREKPVEIQLLSDGSDLELHVIDHTLGFDWPASFMLPQ